MGSLLRSFGGNFTLAYTMSLMQARRPFTLPPLKEKRPLVNYLNNPENWKLEERK